MVLMRSLTWLASTLVLLVACDFSATLAHARNFRGYAAVPVGGNQFVFVRSNLVGSVSNSPGGLVFSPQPAVVASPSMSFVPANAPMAPLASYSFVVPGSAASGVVAQPSLVGGNQVLLSSPFGGNFSGATLQWQVVGATPAAGLKAGEVDVGGGGDAGGDKPAEGADGGNKDCPDSGGSTSNFRSTMDATKAILKRLEAEDEESKVDSGKVDPSITELPGLDWRGLIEAELKANGWGSLRESERRTVESILTNMGRDSASRRFRNRAEFRAFLKLAIGAAVEIVGASSPESRALKILEMISRKLAEVTAPRTAAPLNAPSPVAPPLNSLDTTLENIKDAL
jgi:hypothetical protein